MAVHNRESFLPSRDRRLRFGAHDGRGRRVPARLARIIDTAMAVDPKARHHMADAFADELEAWLTDRPVHGDQRAVRVGLAMKRNWPFVGAAVTALALAAWVLLAVVTASKLEVEKATMEAETRQLAADNTALFVQGIALRVEKTLLEANGAVERARLTGEAETTRDALEDARAAAEVNADEALKVLDQSQGDLAATKRALLAVSEARKKEEAAAARYRKLYDAEVDAHADTRHMLAAEVWAHDETRKSRDDAEVALQAVLIEAKEAADRAQAALAAAKIVADREKTDALAAAKIAADKEKTDALAAAKIAADKEKTDALAGAKVDFDKEKTDALAAAKIAADKEKTDALAGAKVDFDKALKDEQAACAEKISAVGGGNSQPAPKPADP